jgi:hypothetical protein
MICRDHLWTAHKTFVEGQDLYSWPTWIWSRNYDVGRHVARLKTTTEDDEEA